MGLYSSVQLYSASLHFAHGLRPMKKTGSKIAFVQAQRDFASGLFRTAHGWRVKSCFRKRDLRSTIQPQEMDRAGRQDRMIPFTGGMAEKQIGPKNTINAPTIMTNSVIFSFFVFGGVKKIFIKSISNSFLF